MKITAPGTRGVLEAISQDSRISDDPGNVAKALELLYSHCLGDLLDAIDDLATDTTWSPDRQPYAWLYAVAGFLRRHRKTHRRPTVATTWELAAKDEHGGWEYCGDYETRDAAIQAAKRYHEAGNVYTDDGGGSAWGLSSDPGSAHYEDKFSIWTEGGETVVVDPMP